MSAVAEPSGQAVTDISRYEAVAEISSYDAV
jgi:hypothetical protein